MTRSKEQMTVPEYYKSQLAAEEFGLAAKQVATGQATGDLRKYSGSAKVAGELATVAAHAANQVLGN